MTAKTQHEQTDAERWRRPVSLRTEWTSKGLEKSSSPEEGVLDQVAVAFTKYDGQLVSVARAPTRLKAGPSLGGDRDVRGIGASYVVSGRKHPVRNDRGCRPKRGDAA